ncbi:hypothetical protein G6R40_11650 [Chryseobacterium sp. POL2]|uniref:hypothetical protein n=1 Tax=Chryseobacterium sp. POL2 TaxID=2713414 RepID=UPI0013E0F6E9|nr:hypothetical protein [Chryseobacterium sp. POL2]QIG90272.1 hypothetical protein G6R40_11650 [Chryseobacterium sp. POL2]
MKFFRYLLFASLFLVMSCKKTSVDGANRKAFQESINDMTSSLPTLQQIKFNEALYILKTFGVDVDGDVAEIEALGKLLNGKKVPEIMKMADEIAQKNNISWSSTAPPSLGTMNIFGDDKVSEVDPNDVAASALNIIVKPAMSDSIHGPKAFVVIPQLVNQNGEKIEFTGAGLETTLEVFSNGNKLQTAKNMMQDNNFRGFTVKYSSLPVASIIDNKLEVKVSVKTTKKVYQMIKSGIDFNPRAVVKAPVTTEPTEPIDPSLVDPNNPDATATSPDNSSGTTTTASTPSTPKVSSDPKSTVSKFLSNLNSQNLKAAYENAENPAWGSYDKFSNPNSGFGSVKNIKVNSVSAPITKDNTSTINANYDVTDKDGNTTSLNVTYGLKSTANGWKITSYKINSSKKQ